MRLVLLLILAAPLALAAEAVDPVKTLDALLPKMSSANLDERAEAQREYTRIVAHAARPGAERERKAAVQAMLGKLEAGVPQATLLYLLDQLKSIGAAESVPALAKLLGHAEPLVRESARCALQANPAPEALAPLRAALAKAKDPAWQVGLINALGARRDAGSLAAFVKLAASADEGVRVAAAHALARVGDPAGAKAISAASNAKNTLAGWNAILDAYLILADSLAAKGDRARALAMYKPLLDAPGHLRLGALIGLGRAGGLEELPVLFKALADEDAETRGAALAALALLPADVATKAITQEGAATPEVKVGLIRVLVERGDADVLPTLVAGAADPSESVRIAACEGMGKLGDPRAVEVLLKTMARASGKELEAASAAVGAIRGEAVDMALISALEDAKLRVRAMRILAARRCEAAVPSLLEAARGSDPALRAEAVKGLGSFAGQPALSPLVRLLAATPDAKERAQIAKAVTAIIPRVEDVDARADAIVKTLPGAGPEVRAALTSLLARCGGASALDAARKALKDKEPAVREAALRTLGEWPDAAAAPDLLAIARTSGQLAHRVLAIRGYVRLAGLPSDRSAEDTLKLYQDGMAAAPRVEEKKLVLAGMAEMVDVSALAAVQKYLDTAELRSEAVVATVKVAAAVAGTDKAAAKTALAKAIQATQDKKLQKQAQDAIGRIERLADYITAWEVAGPYTAKGKTGPAYHDMVFPPEKGEEAKWQPMPAGRNAETPVLMDLGAVLGGTDRVAYLRTRVWSPSDQKVRMEFGSDDGVKLWVNGKLVLEAKEPRSHRLGEDKKPIDLKKGWNDVLVKVWQGTMDWSISLRFRSPDGKRLDGLRADPKGK